MKKLFLTLIVALLLVPALVSAKSDKVKVYLFTKDGCGYCEYQKQYLEGLSGYGTTFEIVEKQMYDSEWNQDTYYALGKSVADGFNSVGFSEAKVDATPFVVISDLYASTGYNTSLESIINEAYEKGDKDVVTCYEKGNTNCLDHLKESSTSTSTKSDAGTIITIVIATLVLGCTYIATSMYNTNKIINAINKKK